MNEKDKIKKKIDLVTRLYEDEDIIYTGNLMEISTINEVNYPIDALQFDIEATKSFNTIIDTVGLCTPFRYIMKLIKKIINVVSKKTKNTRYRKSEKEKILSDIETLVSSKSNVNDFSAELNIIIGQKKEENLSRLADKACVDYSYLNKLINRKLPNKIVVSRDFTIKLCLALELELNETNNLITRAGYVICGQNLRDIIISVCLQNRAGVITTNEFLYDKECKLL